MWNEGVKAWCKSVSSATLLQMLSLSRRCREPVLVSYLSAGDQFWRPAWRALRLIGEGSVILVGVTSEACRSCFDVVGLSSQLVEVSGRMHEDHPDRGMRRARCQQIEGAANSHNIVHIAWVRSRPVLGGSMDIGCW